MLSPSSNTATLPAHGDVCLEHHATSTSISNANAAVAVVVTGGPIEYLLIQRIDRLRLLRPRDSGPVVAAEVLPAFADNCHTMSSLSSNTVALSAHGDVRLKHPVTSTTTANAAVAVVINGGLVKYLLIQRIDRLR